jgi:hypothetical protein
MLLGFIQKHAGSKKTCARRQETELVAGRGRGVDIVSKRDESTKVIRKVMRLLGLSAAAVM